ncbi:hypothetical protein Dimus_023317 [Dionaea muscipula]
MESYGQLQWSLTTHVSKPMHSGYSPSIMTAHAGTLFTTREQHVQADNSFHLPELTSNLRTTPASRWRWRAAKRWQATKHGRAMTPSRGSQRVAAPVEQQHHRAAISLCGQLSTIIFTCEQWSSGRRSSEQPFHGGAAGSSSRLRAVFAWWSCEQSLHGNGADSSSLQRGVAHSEQ